jgi:hypothetical protein
VTLGVGVGGAVGRGAGVGRGLGVGDALPVGVGIGDSTTTNPVIRQPWMMQKYGKTRTVLKV